MRRPGRAFSVQQARKSRPRTGRAVALRPTATEVTPPTPAMQSRQKQKLFDGQSPNPQTQHMGLTVWVGSWQMQCCGEPFSVGQPVSWTLGDADQDWLMTMLGADAQVTVDAAEEHHDGLPEETPRTTGIVSRIAAVHCRYARAGPALASALSGARLWCPEPRRVGRRVDA
jgi:hypothetical protein